MERVRKKGGARAEDAIQRAVFQHFKARKAPGVFAFHVPNGGARKPIEAWIMKGLGITAGVTDVIAIKRVDYIFDDTKISTFGQCYALELKTEGGKVSTKQRETMQAMRLAGAIVDVTYGLDDALRWLEQHGLLQGRAN